MKLNTNRIGQKAFVRGITKLIPCEVIGEWETNDGKGKMVRVILLERAGCHLQYDQIDYGRQWIKFENE